MRERPSLGSLPTVRPSDIQWLDAARPLLTLPSDTVAVDSVTTLPSPALLEQWVAFFSAAVAFEAEWGVQHGAVRVTTIELDGHRVDVVCGFGRLALLVEGRPFGDPPTAKELAGRLARAAKSGTRYALPWAAAAYALQLLGEE
ncbi:MAG TPA: hypothetical protein VGE37_02590 [Archangium sp.]